MEHRSGAGRSPEAVPDFDDPRDTDAAALWLGLAGVEQDAGQTPVPVDTPEFREAPDLGALLTRASDLPAPTPASGPRVLPWSADAPGSASGPSGSSSSGSSGSRASSRRSRSSQGPRSRTVAAEGRDTRTGRTRAPGPAPLPEDPHEREEAAREVVLRQLALGPRSRRQLEDKLTERGAEPELVARILDRMEEVRLVDDAAFAEVWVRSRHRGKGLARRALRHELQQKGVDRDVAAEALEAIDSEDERAAAEDLVRRRLRGRTVPAGSDPQARAERDRQTRRLVGMLGRKGYGGSLAFTVVREVLAEHEA
ncbi:regulatory protein RecX [Micrococcus sp.]|uniref:regulatory protein RecX n=1 Tax=Micrococcus sp. TaxID=1271 RepID=UPI002A91472F|nr:regulatory protein RecX [Micrococcus sp.]MDY6055115.1 regulatory protein RecX [Micrococcus sp.]